MVVMAVEKEEEEKEKEEEEKEEEEKEAALRNQKEHTVKRELQPRNPRDSVARVGIILSDSGQGREG
jgi:hypothetical protein